MCPILPRKLRLRFDYVKDTIFSRPCRELSIHEPQFCANEGFSVKARVLVFGNYYRGMQEYKRIGNVDEETEWILLENLCATPVLENSPKPLRKKTTK